MFAPYGEVISAKIVTDKFNNNRSKGFGFVEMPDDAAGQLEIGVLDNGPGIPADLVGHLFKPLTTSKKGGLGLGISICFAIA